MHCLTHSRERHNGSINRTALNMVSYLASFQRAPFPVLLTTPLQVFSLAVMLTLFSVCVVSVLSLSLILYCACSFVFVHGQQWERSESHFSSSSSGSHIRSHAFQGSNPMHPNSCRSLEGHHARKSHLERSVYDYGRSSSKAETCTSYASKKMGFSPALREGTAVSRVASFADGQTYAQSRRTHRTESRRKFTNRLEIVARKVSVGWPDIVMCIRSVVL